MNLIPGGPFTTLDGGGVSYLSPDTVQQLRRQYRLDKPSGNSISFVRPYVMETSDVRFVRTEEVSRIIRAALPASVKLGLLVSCSVLATIMMKHVLPNTLSPILVSPRLQFHSIMAEAGLHWG
jgi:ABC-type dipeptide/oligopeptide/nickel transport system permease component